MHRLLWGVVGLLSLALSRESQSVEKAAYSVEGAIHLIHIDGTGATTLLHDTAVNHWPIWSPDGRKLAFASDRLLESDPPDRGDRIYTMDFEGNQITHVSSTVLRNPKESHSRPTWSPDGGKIAFGVYYYEWRVGIFELLWVVDLATQEGYEVTHRPSFTPAWSPDGTQIAFQGLGGNNYDIFYHTGR